MAARVSVAGVAVAVLAVLSLWPARPGAAATGLVSIGAGLKGPAGLKATVYATGLKLVSAFAFDAKGRLWVATSGSSTHGSDGIYLVPGRGAQPVKVVSGPKGPLGLAWAGGSLYVSSLGEVDRFSGLHGPRFASRKLILDGPVKGGENNNLVLAPDGRLLMGVSTSCDHCKPASKWSAAIVSFKLDGSDLRLYASGIRAAFGLVLVPGTSELIASMNQRDDLGAKTPGDWLGVVRQGENWGFPGCYGQGGLVCDGVPKPLAVLDKHAAAGGVAVVGSKLGGGANSSALVSEWELGKVLRVPLTASGSAAAGRAEPFITGLANPLPVVVAPDGSLLLGDWGTGKLYRITG